MSGQDITSFSAKLREVKFAELSTLSAKQIESLDEILNSDIPRLMEELPSEKDSPETLRAKMGDSSNSAVPRMPIPRAANKFGKTEENDSNPFGYSQEDESNYW